ncbi:MAG: lipocalin family protein [Desulfuromonadaceae bacterium]|nr:lipocalin family protein [Desulfuromonadaceae bacterium]
MRSSFIIMITAICISVLLLTVRNSRAASSLPPLLAAPHVDLTRYMGVWHEIARIDHLFQKGCIKSSATYTLLPDGEVEVINRCVNEKDGRLREAKGRAWSVDPEGNARLKVSFFGPFRGDYWIVDLGKEYEYSVVGSPNRQYLWILARQPVMDESVFKGILKKLTTQGFPVDKLVR